MCVQGTGCGTRGVRGGWRRVPRRVGVRAAADTGLVGVGTARLASAVNIISYYKTLRVGLVQNA